MDEFTKTVVIGVSVGIGSFAAVLGIVLTILICKRKRREKRRPPVEQQLWNQRYDHVPPRYRPNDVRVHGQPGAPSAGSSSGKVHRTKKKDRAKQKKRSDNQPPNTTQDSYTPVNTPADLPTYHDPFRDRAYGRPAMWSSNGVPLGAFRQNSLPTQSEISFNKDGTLRGYPGYPHSLRTVSDILNAKNPRRFDLRSTRSDTQNAPMLPRTTWQDSWPSGGPRNPRYHQSMSYDSTSTSLNSNYHYSRRIRDHYGYTGDDVGAGFMSQSIDKKLNRQRSTGDESNSSIYYARR